jgi:hypothetical protein
MDLRYTSAEEAFRSELRAFLQKTVPTLGPKPSADDWPARRAYDTHWQRLLYDNGYAGVDWPVEGGGRGASPVEQLIYLEELERAHAPYVGVNFVGLLHAGPTIGVEGTEEQKALWQTAILKGEQVWCQGFSEPDAGSDLASLRTKAVRDGDEYVITGSKIWTSFGQVADMCEILVRTGADDSRHAGITFLGMPMDLPGIEIRPLRTITGSTEFAELYLTEVRVPVANRVGEENDGWRVAMVTLGFERGTAFVGELLGSMDRLRALRDLAVQMGAGRDKMVAIGAFGAELDALWAMTRRTVSEAARHGVPGIGGNLFKIAFSDLFQKMAEFAIDLIGTAGYTWDEVGRGPLDLTQGGLGSTEIVDTYINSFSRTIAAGTSQIQRNIVAERLLGLPKG